MKRILVTGNAGAGKTTLAREVAALLGLPFHSLDGIVWQARWKKTPPDERERRIHELIETDSWVIDGVSFTVQEQADTVILLDVPRRTSFFRVMKRNWRFLFRSRPGLPPQCPEIRIIPTLCRIIWRFPSRVRGPLLARMAEREDRQEQFHLKSSADVREFLAGIGRSSG